MSRLEGDLNFSPSSLGIDNLSLFSLTTSLARQTYYADSDNENNDCNCKP